MYGKSEWTCTCFHKISNEPVCDSSFKSSHLISVELPKLPKSQRTSCRERYLKGLVCIWQNLLCSRNVEALQPAQRGKLLYLVCAFWAAVKTPVENDTPVKDRQLTYSCYRRSRSIQPNTRIRLCHHYTFRARSRHSSHCIPLRTSHLDTLREKT